MDEFKRVLTTLRVKIDNSDKRLAFFRDNDECHHCGQHIEDTIKDEQTDSAKKEGDKLRKGLQECTAHLKEMQRDLDAASVLQQKIQTIQREVFQHQTVIDTYTPKSAQEAQQEPVSRYRLRRLSWTGRRASWRP